MRNFAAQKRKVGRVIECAGLEIRYTHCGYRGFESLTFRQNEEITSVVSSLFYLIFNTLGFQRIDIHPYKG